MASILPVELYRHVLAHVFDPPTLFNLLLVNKVLFVEAERVLYHTIERKSPKTQISVMHRVLACPRVAAHVRYFDVALVTEPDLEPTFWPLVAQTLQVVTNLASLRLFEMTSSRSVLAADQFPFKLKTFVYWGGCMGARDVGTFLGGQDALEKLVFHAPSSSTLDLPKSALQNLKSIQADASALSSLLPGRPGVSTIRWSSPCSNGEGQEEEEEQEVSFGIEDNFPLDALQGLRSLSFCADTGKFSSIAEYLSGLESLEIHNPQDADLAALRGLTRLRILVINNIDPSIRSQSVIEAMFRDMASLRCVYVENAIPGATYTHWKRTRDALKQRGKVRPQPAYWAEATNPKFAETA